MPRQLLSSDGQLFELSDAAASQSITLQGAKVVSNGAMRVPLLDSGRLHWITTLLEQTAAVFEGMTDERRDALLKEGLPRGAIEPQLREATAAALEGVGGVANFATRLFDLKWFDSPLPMTILAEGVAQLLSGKSVDALRTLLVANDDLGQEEKDAALREPLFSPPSAAVPNTAAPPPLARSISQGFDGDDPEEGNMMACLERCGAQTLCQLKAVSAGWQQRARRALFGRRSDVEVDVEELQHIGRLAAARQMPNLARLRGYGFTVELQAVGQADLEGEVKDDAPLGGVTLRSCIQGEGEPPHELLLAAVACAARGTVRGVPVQRLREDDAIGSLDLDDSGLGVISAELLGLMLPAATSMHTLRCVAGTTPLAQRAQPAFPPPHSSARSLAPTPRCSLMCQRPLTRACSLTALTHPLQSRAQCHRSPGRLRARCRPQEDRDHQPRVRRRPTECSLFCQRPLTRLLSHHSRPAPRLQARLQQDRIQGRLRARRHPQGDADHQPEVRRRPSVRFCVNARCNYRNHSFLLLPPAGCQ